jgi:hypothetical protein
MVADASMASMFNGERCMVLLALVNISNRIGNMVRYVPEVVYHDGLTGTWSAVIVHRH